MEPRRSPNRQPILPRPSRLDVGALALVGLFVIVAVVGWSLVALAEPAWLGGSFSIDFRIYMDALDRWLATGEWYQARQLDGPYPIELGDVLYPPVLILLLLPFKVLGPIAWALLPLSLVAWAVLHHRPRVWALAVIMACVVWPYTPAKFVFGNPVIWAAAALALATSSGPLSRWPAAFALIKPTVAVFGLFGLRDRRWWAALAVGALLSLPFLELTLRYPEVLLNARTNPVDGRGGILYSLQEFPLLAIPLVAWLGGRHRPPIRRPFGRRSG